jgi:hypothetical protein
MCSHVPKDLKNHAETATLSEKSTEKRRSTEDVYLFNYTFATAAVKEH